MKFTSATFLALGLLAEAEAARRLSPRETGESSSGKGGKGKSSKASCPGECDGFSYYKYQDFGSRIPFSRALEFTPPGCVLAPVTSMADLMEIETAAPPGANAWIGITKSVTDVAAAETADDRIENWINLDGSEVPVDSDLWAGGEPNNNPPYQTYAHWYGSDGGLLRDLNPNGNTGPEVTGAIYKCCFDLCVEEPEKCCR